MKVLRGSTVAALAMALVLSFGCSKKQEADYSDTSMTDTVVASGAEQPGVSQPGDVNPIQAQMWVDDFTIGSELAPEGNIVVGKTGDDFAPGQTVYYTMKTTDAPASAAVKAVWYGPGETKINEETMNVETGKPYISFKADTKGWAKGDYRVEAWVGDEKVNSQQFNITDASKSNM